MYILGISAFYHDSAAALLKDGEVIAAAQEERFNRKKHYAGYPQHAIAYCLKEAGVEMGDLHYVAFYDKPLRKFERLLKTYMAFAPNGFSSFKVAAPIWFGDKLFQKENILKKLSEAAPQIAWGEKLFFVEHHFSHAASAFYPSPFQDAAVLTMDGVGEWTTTSLAVGSGPSLEIKKEIFFPHSLGLLYSAVTYYLGFKVNSGEYKVMGLAPYGTPRFSQRMREHLIDIKEDGSFRLNMSYFNYCTGLTMTNQRFSDLFGEPVRVAEQPLTQFHMDIAASVQEVLEDIVLKLCHSVARESNHKNLCLAGGVALNCVANGKILKEGIFENLWVQPAAGDAGGALGAALAVYHQYLDKPRTLNSNGDGMRGSYLGPEYAQDDIETRLRRIGAKYTAMDEGGLLQRTAGALADGQAIGWMQGRMEFGPRALGGRSILADPRSTKMQKNLNLKVKYRESFRPFAPSVCRENVHEWFDLDTDSPYMLIVSNVLEKHRIEMSEHEQSLFGVDKINVPRSNIPAVTHVDYSARIQTVHAETNPKYHALLQKFKQLTGCPVLVNTSFNVRGEPVVCSPEDAFHCFMGTELDVLVVGNCYLEKSEQDPSLAEDYKNMFELD